MSGPHPDPILQHFLDGKLEPECRDVQTPQECAQLSIAISLKRIADKIDLVAAGLWNTPYG